MRARSLTADEPFTEEFKQGVKKMTRSEVRFGFIGPEMWGYPDWIDQTRAAESRKKMAVRPAAARLTTGRRCDLRMVRVVPSHVPLPEWLFL